MRLWRLTVGWCALGLLTIAAVVGLFGHEPSPRWVVAAVAWCGGIVTAELGHALLRERRARARERLTRPWTNP